MIKILIVDDSISFLDRLSRVLHDEKFEVLTAKSGQEGIERCVENDDIEVIISDLHMPEMDGLSMCSYIRKHNLCSGVKILILTTETGKEERRIGKELDVIAWLIKPLDHKQLISVINKITL